MRYLDDLFRNETGNHAHYLLPAQSWLERPDIPYVHAFAGLQPTERGKFVHAAFAAFWRVVRDQRTLLALDEPRLAATIAQAVSAGRAAVDDALWAALPPVVAAVESGHVERLMRQWIDTVERNRPPFAVADAERRVDYELQKLVTRRRRHALRCVDQSRCF